MSELLPCPFCGGEAAYSDEIKKHPLTFEVKVHCSDCAARLVVISHNLQAAMDEAAKRWNTRSERTCQIENLYEIKDGYFVAELSCNHTHTVSYEELPLRYCSDCGAKVVDDESNI